MPSKFEIDDLGEQSLDYSLPPKTISSFISDSVNGTGTAHWTVVEEPLLEKIRPLSVQRVAANAEFAKIRKELEEMKAQNGIMKVSQSKKDQDLDGTPDEEKPKSARKGKGARSRATDTAEYLKDPGLHEAVEVAADMAVSAH